MRSTYPLQLRRFGVLIRDERTGETKEDTIVFTRDQLQAAQLVGQSSKELICRACSRAGYTVLNIGKAHKREAVLDLDKLFQGGGKEVGV